jgi:hypothetical protein
MVGEARLNVDAASRRIIFKKRQDAASTIGVDESFEIMRVRSSRTASSPSVAGH